MRQLLPPASGTDFREIEGVDLDTAYAYPPSRAWVRANVVASADGAATAQGRSDDLSGPADRRVLGLLRGLADVVLVGAGTARAESYRPLAIRPSYAGQRAAAGQLPAAALAVVSARLDLDPDGPLFATSTAAPTLLITCASAPADRRGALADRGAEVIVAGDRRVDLPEALDVLAARGLGRILCEGGPSLISQIAAAGRLDELCLTISPQLLGGDAARILSGAALTAPLRLRLAGLLEEDGFLFTRYVARP